MRQAAERVGWAIGWVDRLITAQAISQSEANRICTFPVRARAEERRSPPKSAHARKAITPRRRMWCDYSNVERAALVSVSLALAGLTTSAWTRSGAAARS